MFIQWRNIHVYITSTLMDTHAERDDIVQRVLPELTDWSESSRPRLVDVDPRWGVTEADAAAKANMVRTRRRNAACAASSMRSNA